MLIFCADFWTISSWLASTQTEARSLAKSTKHDEKKTQKEHKMDPFADCERGSAFVRGEAVYSKNEVSNDDLQYSVFLLDILCSSDFSLEPPETEK